MSRAHALLAGLPSPKQLCRAGWTGLLVPQRNPMQHMLRVLLLLLAVALATGEEPLCDLSPFTEQTPEGVEPCKSCFFPTYPGLNSFELAKYPAQDFDNQWIYFSGDSTLRQVYGEFYGIIHRTQVCACSLLLSASYQRSHQGQSPIVPEIFPHPVPCMLTRSAHEQPHAPAFGTCACFVGDIDQ